MKQPVFIGTYTEGTQYHPHDNAPVGRGIHTALFDFDTGSIDEVEPVAETPNPSWLARHPHHPVLYSVNETPIEGYRGGGLSVFLIAGERKLVPAGRFDTLGLAPCHLAVDPAGRFLVVSNYRGGNFTLFRLDENGIPCPEPAVFQSSGSGPNLPRQEGPHAHSAAIDPRTGEILMVDLGTDTVYVRRFDETSDSFSEQTDLDFKVLPGSGCRHLVFSPDGDMLYVVGELDATICVFRRGADGFDGPVQSVSCLPFGAASAIIMHPSGRWLYVSIRGEGTLCGFPIDMKDGRLTRIQNVKTDCTIPRFCGLAPGGGYLVVCGLDSASIETFRVDPDSGKLAPVRKSPSPDSPACLLW